MAGAGCSIVRFDLFIGLQELFQLRSLLIGTLDSHLLPSATCNGFTWLGFTAITRFISFHFTVLFIQWGQVICTHTCAVCNDDGKTYIHGDNWKLSNDSCLTCRCEVCKSNMLEPVSSAAPSQSDSLSHV